MARIEPINIRQWPPEMRDAVAAMAPPAPRHSRPILENRPKSRNTLGSFAHHPALARAFFTFNGHILLDAGATDIWAFVYPVGTDKRASLRRMRELLKQLAR